MFLDSLLALDAKEPIYLGTSLNRWPSYHAHFTGMVTGFSHSLVCSVVTTRRLLSSLQVQTLTAGIGKMSREDIQTWWDDDVLTGEIMVSSSLARIVLLPRSSTCHPDLNAMNLRNLYLHSVIHTLHPLGDTLPTLPRRILEPA